LNAAIASTAASNRLSDAGGVLDAFGIGERDEARADRHGYSIGEAKANKIKRV
jgi:hypothetical protein